jgi:methylated-DNA-[protein]-cysteine S-methyltransferase
MSMKNPSLITLEAPFGAVLIKKSQGKLQIELTHAIETFIPDDAVEFLAPSDEVTLLCTQLQHYFKDKNSVFNLPFDPVQSQQGTDFQKCVWQAIVEIPIGETQTYSEIAKKIGSGPRAVANACGANALSIVVPCHRVVAKNGLGGYMQGNPQGLMIKKWLLQHEGVRL